MNIKSLFDEVFSEYKKLMVLSNGCLNLNDKFEIKIPISKLKEYCDKEIGVCALEHINYNFKNSVIIFDHIDNISVSIK